MGALRLLCVADPKCGWCQWCVNAISGRGRCRAKTLPESVSCAASGNFILAKEKCTVAGQCTLHTQYVHALLPFRVFCSGSGARAEWMLQPECMLPFITKLLISHASLSNLLHPKWCVFHKLHSVITGGRHRLYLYWQCKHSHSTSWLQCHCTPLPTSY